MLCEHPYICWIIIILKLFDKLVLHILFYDISDFEFFSFFFLFLSFFLVLIPTFKFSM